jgi:hypothetical protein
MGEFLMRGIEMSLLHQVQRVFDELDEELADAKAGVVFIQLRNDTVGKFGVRHDAITGSDMRFTQQRVGLSEKERTELRKRALNALDFKRGWTHGEMEFEFASINGLLRTSILLESNYNMSALKTV